MMKILLSLLIVFISFNGRSIFWVTSSESDKISAEGDQFHRKNVEKTCSENSEGSKLVLENSHNFLEKTKKQEILLPSQSVIGDPPFLDNIEVSGELSTTAETVVFPSADSVVEWQKRVKSQFHNENTNSSSNQFFSPAEHESQEYVVHAEPKLQVQPITEETVRREINESESVPTSTPEDVKKSAPQHEDIPSFSEWSQKQLAEAEKKKSDQNETSERFAKTRGKFRNKNYASPDCGAKIVASNPESLSSSAVLSSLKDEYMLNYCTNRIWFVVELCEAIQAKQLDLANFELFSSSPKLFSVFVSHRFPTRDWSNVGKFTAQDTRDVQTFNLQPYLFGKYVKVELHSHYGKEQFCPISWVGVYGTSEYEVLAKEDERHSSPDDDDQYEEDLFLGQRTDSRKNLFSSATDAVLSIVKKATAPFMKAENNDTNVENEAMTSDSERSPCVSPRHITVCNNCTQSFYDEVFLILSCQQTELDRLLGNAFVRRTLINSEACTKFGLNFGGLRTGAPFPSLENPRQEVNYLSVMLREPVVAALCNVLAVLESKVVVNGTIESDRTLRNVTEKSDSCEVNSSKFEIPLTLTPSDTDDSDCLSPFSSLATKTSLLTDIFGSQEQLSKKIEPTKTLTEDEVKMLPPSDVYSESSAQKVVDGKSTDLSKNRVTSTATTTVLKERSEVESHVLEQKVSFLEPNIELEKESEAEIRNANTTSGENTLESIISDLNAMEKASDSPISVVPSTSNLPAESIFLRLANRIKNLEINMSLSSTYLEELSKRYRVQLELLSKTLNLTIQRMEEQTRADEEKERRKEKEIVWLRLQLANLSRDVSTLLRERNSWRPRASSISQHLFIISVEILLVWSVFNYWKRSSDSKTSIEKVEIPKRIARKWKRRNSLEGVKGHETPRRRARRPSDEALEIALSRSDAEDIFKVEKKKRRRKKDSKCSIHMIQVKRKKSDSNLAQPSDGLAEASRPSSVSEETQAPEFSLKDDIQLTNRFAPISSPQHSQAEGRNAVSKAFQGFSTPTFMKTALAARHSRLRVASEKESSQEESLGFKSGQDFNKKERKSSTGLKKYMKKFF